MQTILSHDPAPLRKPRAARAALALAHWFLPALLAFSAGCGLGKIDKPQDEFFTSGSREADQRASQRMAKAEQLEGSEGDADADAPKDAANQPPKDEEKRTLYDRLGGEPGISRIVDDFVSRVLHDPRVNWQRAGLKRGLFRRVPVNSWEATPENVAILKRHMSQFLALAAGGPARYGGEEMESTHAGMRISNSEFDAVIGDLKASLDKLQIPDREQKELLAIVESTRPQIVTER
jgi:hemoglobin